MAGWDFCQECNGGTFCSTHSERSSPQVQVVSDIKIFTDDQLAAELRRRRTEKKQQIKKEFEQLESDLKALNDRFESFKARRLL